MPPSESVSSSSLEIKGQGGDVENHSLKGQIMESSNSKEIPRTIFPDVD